ncbi:phosphoribosylaminoimidazolesuccinocarboxamide synthase [Bacillus horti]
MTNEGQAAGLQQSQSCVVQIGTEQVQVSKQEQLYEGKAKRIYKTTHPELYWVVYKDDATAFNGEKKAQVSNKGMLNNLISTIFFEQLAQAGVKNHFVQAISDREQIVRQVSIIPVEVVVRNIAAGSMAKRLGIEEGQPLAHPVLEFYYKDDALGDPLINDDHVYMLQLANEQQISTMKELALQVNSILVPFLLDKKITLVDFKLEFGVGQDGNVILADEISPDTCRFWDSETQEKLDKDRFRRDLGGVEEAYQEILQRLGGQQHV